MGVTVFENVPASMGLVLAFGLVVSSSSGPEECVASGVGVAGVLVMVRVVVPVDVVICELDTVVVGVGVPVTDCVLVRDMLIETAACVCVALGVVDGKGVADGLGV